MKMSSRRAALERGSVTQHRPQNGDSSSSERDQSLRVLLALLPLAVVEGPGLWGASQACEGRLVEDPFENLIPSSHPAMVAHPLAGVPCRGHEPGVGGEPVGTLEGAQIA